VLRYHKDPIAQLQKLAKQQSEVLLRRLGGSGESSREGVSRDIPARPFPFGSEDINSPTYVAQSSVLSPQPVKGSTTTSLVRGMGGEGISSSTPRTASMESGVTMVIEQPSYSGPGAAWEKDEDIPTSETPLPPTEEERDVLDT
jgi:glycogenin glucosyltransferase